MTLISLVSRYILDHENYGQNNDGQMGSPCSDKAVLAQKGGTSHHKISDVALYYSHVPCQ